MNELCAPPTTVGGAAARHKHGRAPCALLRRRRLSEDKPAYVGLQSIVQNRRDQDDFLPFPPSSPSQVCANVACCYAVASQFEGCRERIQETSAIIRDLVRILYYRVSVSRRASPITPASAAGLVSERPVIAARPAPE